MNKKILMIICAVTIVIATVIPVSIIIIKNNSEKALYSSFYTLKDNFIIEASNGSLSQKKNTVEFIKTAYNSGANCVELDLTFDPSGEPYIESDPYNIKDGTLKLEQVLKMLSNDSIYKDSKIDLKINSVDNLQIVDELCEKYGMTDRVFFSGINLSQSKLIKESTSLPYYLSIEIKKSDDNDYIESIFNDISVSESIGVICNVDNVSKLLCDILYENWISISFENVNTKTDCIKALKMNPTCIKTNKPYLVQEIVQKWQNEAPIEFYGIETTTEN